MERSKQILEAFFGVTTMIFFGNCAFTDFYLPQSQSCVTFVMSKLLCYIGDINVYKRFFLLLQDPVRFWLVLN